MSAQNIINELKGWIESEQFHEYCGEITDAPVKVHLVTMGNSLTVRIDDLA
jgi:hypothetical protein